MNNVVKVYVDAAGNRSSRVVNRFGKKVTTTHPGYKIGLICGDVERQLINRKAEHNQAAETYACLKGFELALELHPEAKKVIVFSDCQHIGGEKGTQAGKYRWVMEKIARENNVELEIEWISGTENPADRVSRLEIDTAPAEASTTAPAGASREDMAQAIAREMQTSKACGRPSAAKKIDSLYPGLDKDTRGIIARMASEIETTRRVIVKHGDNFQALVEDRTAAYRDAAYQARLVELAGDDPEKIRLCIGKGIDLHRKLFDLVGEQRWAEFRPSGIPRNSWKEITDKFQ